MALFNTLASVSSWATWQAISFSTKSQKNLISEQSVNSGHVDIVRGVFIFEKVHFQPL
jgi:hypothetical protein